MATIQGVYVALFGRPADPTGLAFFNGVTKNGADLNGIGDLTSTQEYKDRFKDQTNAQIVNSIYQSLFNRDAEATGLNFFVDALNKGTLNIKNIAIAILDGAQGADKTIVTNKITAADNFTKATDTPVEIATYTGNTAAQAGRDFLKQVTADTATIPTAAATDTAIANIGTTVNKGNTVNVADVNTDVTVTSAVAATQPTTAVASDKDDTITIAQITSAVTSGTGKINGGFGTDTLKYSTQGGNGTANNTTNAGTAGATATVNYTPELTSIEKLVLTAKGGNGGNGDGTTAGGAGGDGSITLNLSKATSVSEIVNEGSVKGTAGSSATGGALGNGNITLSEVALSTKIGFKGTVSGDTTITFKDASGTADAINVALDGATVSGAQTFNGVEVLNVSSTGDSSVSSLFGAKTINLSGAGKLNVTVANGETTAIVNTATVEVTANLSAASKLATYTGSSSIDKVTIDVAGLTSNVAINTGAGADTINVVRQGSAAGADKAITLTGGEGSDLINFGATSAALDNVKVSGTPTVTEITNSLVTITDFNKAQDSISFAGTKVDLNVGQLGNVAGQGSLLDAVKAAAGFAGTGKGTVFSYGGDTYLYNDTNSGGAAAGFSAGDALVKVAGIASTDLTTSNLTWVA